jgi:molybdopterin converting factor small subunit
MTVTVRLFASYAERLGRTLIELDLPDGSTAGDAVTSISRLPGGSTLPPAPLVAVNLAYAAAAAPLKDGDEIAIIPPVAGG